MMKTEKSRDLISRADAIEAVAKAKATDPFGRYDKQNIGIDWALDALKALPSTEQVTGKLKKPCNPLLTDEVEECKEKKGKLDLISRQDAIDAVMNIEPTFDTRTLEPYQKEKDVVSAINSLPSASVEVGEWVWKTDDLSYWYVCSQCGERPMCNRFSYREERSNFCPNCGARMTKGGEDE